MAYDCSKRAPGLDVKSLLRPNSALPRASNLAEEDSWRRWLHGVAEREEEEESCAPYRSNCR